MSVSSISVSAVSCSKEINMGTVDVLKGAGNAAVYLRRLTENTASVGFILGLFCSAQSAELSSLVALSSQPTA